MNDHFGEGLIKTVLCSHIQIVYSILSSIRAVLPNWRSLLSHWIIWVSFTYFSSLMYSRKKKFFLALTFSHTILWKVVFFFSSLDRKIFRNIKREIKKYIECYWSTFVFFELKHWIASLHSNKLFRFQKTISFYIHFYILKTWIFKVLFFYFY